MGKDKSRALQKGNTLTLPKSSALAFISLHVFPNRVMHIQNNSWNGDSVVKKNG